MVRSINRSTLVIQALLGRAEIFNLIGRNTEAMKDLDRGIIQSQVNKDRTNEARCHVKKCEVFGSRGEFRAVLRHARHALQIGRKIDDKKIMAACLNNIGYGYYHCENYALAHEYYLQALTIVQSPKPCIEQAETLLNLGTTYYYLRQYKKELQKYRECLSLAEKHGDLRILGVCLNHIASWYKRTGKSDMYMAYLLKSLNIRRMIGDRQGQALTLNNLSVGCIESGDYRGAVEYAENALQIQKEIHHCPGQVFTYYNLGIVHFFLGEYRRSVHYIMRSLHLAQQIKDTSSVGYCLNILGEIWTERGSYNKARNFLHEAKKIVRQIKDTHLYQKITRSLGALALANGELDKAHTLADKAMKLASELKLSTAAGEATMLFARVLGRQLSADTTRAVRERVTEREKVEAAFGEAISIFDKIHHGFAAAQAKFYYGVFLKKHGDEKAKGYLSAARKTFKKVNARTWLGKVNNAL